LQLSKAQNILCSIHETFAATSDAFRQSNQLHQELITLFEKELVLEILLVLGQELELRENSQYNLLMMELLHHLLKSQDPAAVARSEKKYRTSSSNKVDKKSSSLLASKLHEEKSSRRGLVGVRHGHFGGTWVTQQVDGKRQYIGAALSKKQRFVAPKRKNRKAEPFLGSGKSLLAHSSRFAIDEGPTTQRANKSLNNFCLRFVKDCYGPVMKSLKNEFRRDSVRLEEGDKVVFFRLVWFFCQWWRVSHKNKSLDQLIFTMDVFTFNLVLNATDSFYQHKKHARLAQAVALYSEMMLLLHKMQVSNDSTESDIALGLLNRLFYVSEPLDRLPKLLSRWTPGTYTREYLCDLVEICHVSLKLLDANAKANTTGLPQQNKKQKKNSGANNNVEKMRLAAEEFDVKFYFCRKILSNQLITMYVHLLGQYRLNSMQINHHVIAMFLRLSRTEIFAPDAHDVDSPINLLGSRRVTYEPMLYSIHLFMVLERILNDRTVCNDKDFASVINFSSNHMYKFWSAAQENPMAYVECLFRQLHPHRFCELFTNLYVSEELRMLAEREMLLEEQYRQERDGNGNEGEEDSDDDDDEEIEFTGGNVKAVEIPKKAKSALSDSDTDDDNSVSVNMNSLKRDQDNPESVKQSNEENFPVKRDNGSIVGASDEEERTPKKPKTSDSDGSDEEMVFGDDEQSPALNKTLFTDDD
jgi:timeless